MPRLETQAQLPNKVHMLSCLFVADLATVHAMHIILHLMQFPLEMMGEQCQDQLQESLLAYCEREPDGTFFKLKKNDSV